ncbi:KIAA1430-like protein-domain-containing protein [Entophlyctis helioformis]|nr:KIAA1430-like protein-domain-containing protein [Entophlyctis helioformis]
MSDEAAAAAVQPEDAAQDEATRSSESNQDGDKAEKKPSAAAPKAADKDPLMRHHPDPLDQVDPPGPECDEAALPATKTRIPDPFPYRHYKAFHPCSNKLLAMKWDQTLRQQHLKKLAAAKPTIDNSAPKPYMHLQMKLKKLQMEEDRLALIERNNRILLEKMSHIMEMEAKDPNIHGDRDYAHSLNAGFRAREMGKIRAENRALLGRLEAKQPHYDHIKWIDERLRNLAYLQNISCYPHRYIELRKEWAKQVVPVEQRKKARSLKPDKAMELRAVFMPPTPVSESGESGHGVDGHDHEHGAVHDDAHAAADGSGSGSGDGGSKKGNPKTNLLANSPFQQSQHPQQGQHGHARKAGAAAAATAGGAGAKTRKPTKAVPVAEVDRVASGRGPRKSVPLPEIAKSTDKPPLEESPVTMPLPEPIAA